MQSVTLPKVTGRTFVLAVGKAASHMTAAIYPQLPQNSEGLVITRQGYALTGFAPRNFAMIEASHPVPDDEGASAAIKALAAADSLGEGDLLLVLMSGGASALMPCPANGLSLMEKQAITRSLLHSGAPIGKMNIVRKHLSAIKGGHLAARAFPAATHMIAISDIPGDDPAMIGSGPTLPDSSTCLDTLGIIDDYGIAIPDHVRAHLLGGHWETPKPDVREMQCATYQLCARPADMCAAACDAAQAMGYEAIMLGDALEGEAAYLGREHAALALKLKAEGRKAALISGGEATVTVRNRGGRGGRCSAYLLACAIALNDAPGICGFAADSDGIDGSQDNAGGYLWSGTLKAIGGTKTAQTLLDTDNSYTAFAAADALLITGPSGTNVNDLRVLLVDG